MKIDWFYVWLSIRHPSALIRYLKFWIEWKERPPIGVMLLDDRELTEEEYNASMIWGEEKLQDIYKLNNLEKI